VNDDRLELRRARDELAAARHLQAGAFPAQAISRAYYAGFYAAEAALAQVGVTRSKHSAVIAAFIQRLVRAGEIDPEAGRLLRSLFDRRSGADYDWVDAPSLRDSETAIGDAEQVVRAVAEWLSRSKGER
jgi:uncharacterized protein (UPF0332 family)